MSEVFRFVVQRPVQRAAQKDVKQKLIAIFPAGETTPLRTQLLELRLQQDREGMEQACVSFMASNQFVSTLTVLATPLAQLDSWLLDREDRATPSEVAAHVKAVSGKTPKELVATAQYRSDRLRVADSLLALTVSPSGREQLRSGLLRGLYIFGLLDQLAADVLKAAMPAAGTTPVAPVAAKVAGRSSKHQPPKGGNGNGNANGQGDDDDDHGGAGGDRDETMAVHQLLTRGIVALPSDPFPLPAERTAPVVTIAAHAKREEKAHTELAVHATQHRTLIDAARQLRSALAETGSSNSEVAGSVRPWALNSEQVSRLQPELRALVTRVSGPSALDDVPATLVRLEAEAARVGSLLPVAVTPSSHAFAPSPLATPARLPADALVRAPGIAELKVVRQKLLRYEMGEIAHIENVLKGEFKERVHRRKNSTETTVLTETERTQETEQDLQTTQRFELQREASQTIHEDSALDTGLTVTASYGPTVSATASLSYASNHAKDESLREASTYARDVTERSLTRVKERVHEQRTVRTLTEVEETNKHGIDNTKGDGHVVGVYRWVDKIYEAQVFNYGQRLLLEFNVPEPAAFLLHALARQTSGQVSATRPEFPVVMEGDHARPLSPADIRPETYLSWVQQYQVSSVTAPPQWFDTVATTLEEPVPTQDPTSRTIFKANTQIEIPEGYRAVRYHIDIKTDNNARERMLISWSVGNHSDHVAGRTDTGEHAPWSLQAAHDLPLQTEGKLPVSLYLNQVWGYAVTLQVVCERTEQKLMEWQLKTYESIMRAYYELKAQYDEQVAAASARAGIQLPARTPLQNRLIEQTELKKGVITLLRGSRFEGFDAVEPGPEQYPEIDIPQALKEGRIMQFFEQAFEWPQMTYTFYPYFWGRKDQWPRSLQLDDMTDPVFGAFLRAGAARVVVPVRPGFEMMAAHYLATDQIWGGDQVPHVGDELYISIAQEIQNQQITDGGTPEGEPWEVRLPTTLAMLQPDGNLPA